MIVYVSLFTSCATYRLLHTLKTSYKLAYRVTAYCPRPAIRLARESEEADGPLRIWRDKHKYFLVIAVDQPGVPGTDLPFVAVDGAKVTKALERSGYRPLVGGPLTGVQATRDGAPRHHSSSAPYNSGPP